MSEPSAVILHSSRKKKKAEEREVRIFCSRFIEKDIQIKWGIMGHREFIKEKNL